MTAKQNQNKDEKILKEVLERNISNEFIREQIASGKGIKAIHGGDLKRVLLETISLSRLSTSNRIIEMIEENIENIKESNFYKKVLQHRGNCSNWKNGSSCIKCWGNGLTKSREEFFRELISQINQLNNPHSEASCSEDNPMLRRTEISKLGTGDNYSSVSKDMGVKKNRGRK